MKKPTTSNCAGSSGAPSHASHRFEQVDVFNDDLSAKLSEFARTSIETCVSVKPGQVAIDGVEITTGLDIVRVFGGSPTFVLATLIAIGAKNEASAQEKKAWWSLSGSDDSSDAPAASGPAADGPSPEGTAGRAEPAGMTGNEAAMGETDAPSSGSTATLS